MDENSIGKVVVDAAITVHRELGPGLLETVYEVVLLDELLTRRLGAKRQVSIPINVRGIRFTCRVCPQMRWARSTSLVNLGVPVLDYVKPEDRARMRIDAGLAAAGWEVQDYKHAAVAAAPGVAVREAPTEAGPADYVLFVDGQAVGSSKPRKRARR